MLYAILYIRDSGKDGCRLAPESGRVFRETIYIEKPFETR